MTRALATRILIVLAVCLTGCAGPLARMRELPTEHAFPTDSHNATVVFLRPSGLGFAIASSVYEVTPSGDRFVGIVPAKKKLAYTVAPGPTRFMVIGETADFMDADVVAGKTYYAVVAPRLGIWKARFSLRPVSAQGLDATELTGWLDECRPIENTDESRGWATEHWADIQEKRQKHLADWEAKTDRPRLLATDGR